MPIEKRSSLKTSWVAYAGLVAVLVLLGCPSFAQDVRLESALHTGGGGADSGEHITLDAGGNIYAAGTFEGSVDFDPGTGDLTKSSAGGTDVYVQKFDSSGNLLWVATVGGGGAELAQGLAVDSSGNVFVSGSFTGMPDFDPSGNLVQLTSVGGTDIFILKLDSDGLFQWVHQLGDTTDEESGGIAVDGSGNVYTTGSFSTSFDADPGGGIVMLPVIGATDVFVQSFDTDGTFRWARTMGGAGADVPTDIETDSNGNVYSVGYFVGAADFDLLAAGGDLTPIGDRDIFIQKHDSSGNFVWAGAAGGTGTDVPNDVQVDSVGNVYATGTFRGTADFDPSGQTSDLMSAGSTDVFALKWDTDGAFIWVAGIGGTNSDDGFGVAVGLNGDVYVTGGFAGTADFDPSDSNVDVDSAGDSDFFVVSLDRDGDFVWVKTAGGTGTEQGNAIAVDAADSVFSTGSFEGTVDFDPGDGLTNLSAAAGADVFIQKLVPHVDARTDFAMEMGGAGSDLGETLVLDADGNIYTSGVFEGTADLDPSLATLDLMSQGSADVYVQKLDADGILQWARSFGGTNQEINSGLAVDTSGNVYVTGTFFGTVDFDPGAGMFELSSTDTRDVFVLKLDSMGDFEWAKNFGEPTGSVTGGIAVDGEGNVYTAGDFLGIVDFDPGSGVFELTSAGSDDVFVQKLDSDGDFVWAAAMGGINADMPEDILVDDVGDVYIAGSFIGMADFDPLGVDVNADLTSGGDQDAFIVKLDTDGAFVWAANVGGTGADQAKDIEVDRSGNVLVTGGFTGTADFDPSGSNFDLTGLGAADIFVLKLDPNGALLWAVSAGGVGVNRGLAIDSDRNSDIYISGQFGLTVDFDPGPGVLDMTSAGLSDIFVLKLTDDGLIVWAKTMGGAGFDQGSSIAVDSGSSVFTTGVFTGDADFDPSVGVNNLSGFGGFDIFIHKLIPLGATGPNVIIGAPSPSLTSTGPVDFPITYTNATSISLFVNDVVLRTTGTVTGTASVSGAGNINRTVTISNITGDGTLTITLRDSTAIDSRGNFAPSTGTVQVVTVDNTPPGVVIGAPSQSFSSSGPVTYEITYTGATSVALTEGDITLTPTPTASGSISVTNGTTSTPTVTVSNLTGDGTLTITIAGGTAADAAGNLAAPVGPSDVINVDNTPPGILIGPPSQAFASTGPVTFAVSYTGANAVNLTQGDINLSGPGDASGDVGVTNGTTSSPTVTISNIVGDGLLNISIGPNTASDQAGNMALATGPSQSFTADNTPPGIIISAPSVPATNSGPVSYTLTYVGASNIVLTKDDIGLNGAGVTGDVEVTGSGNAARTVTISDITGEGPLSISIDSDTAIDEAGNLALASGPSDTVDVDKTPPGVSISVPSLSATNDGPVTFTITYTGADNISLTGGDVVLNRTDTAVGAKEVTGTGNTTRTVTISSIAGDGTLSISLPSDTARDAAGNQAPSIGPSSTILIDNTPPEVTIGPPSASATNSGPVSFIVSYSGASNVTLVKEDITLNTAGGSVNGTVVVSGTGATSRTVTLQNITGEGPVSISIASDSARDAIGNLAMSVGPSQIVDIDKTPPSITISQPQSKSLRVSSGPMSYTVTYGGATTITLAPGDVTLNSPDSAAGTVNVSGTGNTTRTVTISNITGDGNLGVSIDSGTARDAAGNLAPAAGPSASLFVDNTAPILTVFGDSVLLLTCGDTFDDFVDPGTLATDNSEVPVEVASVVEVDSGDPNLFLITYTAEDADGNVATASRQVVVIPPVAPVLTLVGDDDVTLVALREGYEELGATVEDICDAELIIGGDIVDDLTPGVYVVTYNATNSVGLDAVELTRTVTVLEETQCALIGEVLTTLNEFRTDFDIDSQDFDGDGLPEEATLSLIEFVLCLSENAELTDATQNAFRANVAIFDAEPAKSVIKDYRSTIAALMLISSNTEAALKELLADEGLTLTGDYVSVVCDDATGQCTPDAIPGVAVEETFEEFVGGGKTLVEPYSGGADFDNGGTSNADEWAIILEREGTLEDFIDAVTNPRSLGEGFFGCAATPGAPGELIGDIFMSIVAAMIMVTFKRHRREKHFITRN